MNPRPPSGSGAGLTSVNVFTYFSEYYYKLLSYNNRIVGKYIARSSPPKTVSVILIRLFLANPG